MKINNLGSLSFFCFLLFVKNYKSHEPVGKAEVCFYSFLLKFLINKWIFFKKAKVQI